MQVAGEQVSQAAGVLMGLSIPEASLQWGLLGIAFLGTICFALKTGKIPWGDGGWPMTTREEDRFEFNSGLFWAALMATIFIGFAIAFYFYPNASKPMIRDELPAELRD